MIYFDEQSSLNFKLEEQLKTSLSNLVQRGCDTLGVFQGLLLQIEDEAVDVIIKASSAYPPNFKTLPSFATYECFRRIRGDKKSVNKANCLQTSAYWLSDSVLR